MAVNTPVHLVLDEAGLVNKVSTIAPDAATATLVSNATTVASGKYGLQITTEALVTAAAGSQALTLTVPGVITTDQVLVQYVGGTNTRRNFTVGAVCTTNTVTLTVYNNEPTNALNGTIILNVLVMKA